jgi:YD repeat-containing protein
VYDELGRQVQVIEGSGESATPRPPEAIDRITENTYDQDGRLTRIASPEGTINYKCDSVTGRKIRTWTTNSDLRYSHDELGRGLAGQSIFLLSSPCADFF